MKNSMAYVTSKLGITAAASGQQQAPTAEVSSATPAPALSVEDTELVEKIGGRMIDLETVSLDTETLPRIALRGALPCLSSSSTKSAQA